jgi:2-dehydro-3-deoxygalactonokinase
MTGKLFEVLKDHSILGDLIESSDHDPDAFSLGVHRARCGAALTRLLFSARTECLFGSIAPRQVASYLSGLLIGSDVGYGAEARDVILRPSNLRTWMPT